jgi:hypothetical protein
MFSIPKENSRDNNPYIILVSVDRTIQGVVSAPVYTSASGETFAESALLLDMPYKDLLEIIQAVDGLDTMPIPWLLQFSFKAAQYGFSSETFLQIFMTRLCFPFVLFILCLVFSILAWNYRRGMGQIFTFPQIIILPVLTCIIYFFQQASLYLVKLMNCSMIAVLQIRAVPVILGALALMIAGLIFRFMLLRTTE